MKVTLMSPAGQTLIKHLRDRRAALERKLIDEDNARKLAMSRLEGGIEALQDLIDAVELGEVELRNPPAED